MSLSSDEKIVFSQGKLFDSITSSRSLFSHSGPMLIVVLDCLYFVAGEKVNGEIFLSIPNDYPSGILKINSKGTEEGKVINKSLTQKNIIYNISTVVES